MKILLILLLASLSVLAQEVRFGWDASPTIGVTNYVLMAHTNSYPTTNYTDATVKIGVGTNLTAKVTDLATGRWYFWAVAQKDGVASDPSNVVAVEVPLPPAGMRTISVQYGATLVGGMTNLIYFKLHVP